jgi:hypothetical protein
MATESAVVASAGSSASTLAGFADRWIYVFMAALILAALMGVRGW